MSEQHCKENVPSQSGNYWTTCKRKAIKDGYCRQHYPGEKQMKRKGKFRVYKKKNTRQFKVLPDVYWYFTLHAANGRFLATSGIYKSKQACLKGISSVAKNAPDAVVEVM